MCSLKADTDNFLAIASLFEESFSIDWVLEITGIKATTGLRAIEDAIQNGLIAQTDPGIYCFLDQAQRKKLRATLPKNLLDNIQRKIIELYLRETPDENTFTQQITTHLMNIDNDTEGCRWLMQAGLYYKKRFERDKARLCFSKILHDIDIGKMHIEEADRLYITAAIEYCKSVDSSDYVTSAYPFLDNALQRAQELKDQVSMAAIVIHLSSVEWFRGNHVESYGHFEKACALMKNIKDPDWQGSFTILKIIGSTVWGKYQEALQGHEKFTPDVAKYPRFWYSFRGAIYFGVSLAHTGSIAQGLGTVHSIRNHCRKMGNLSIAIEAGVQLVNMLIDIRDVDKAIHYIGETLQEADAIKTDFPKKYLLEELAYCHYLNREYEKSVDALRQCPHSDKKEFSYHPGYPYVLELAWAMEQKKYPRLEGYNWHELIRNHIDVPNLDVKGIAFRLKALLEAKSKKPSEHILDALLQSQRWLEESGHKTELIRTQIEIRRYYLSANDVANADQMEARINEALAGIDPDLIPGDISIFNKVQRNEKVILSEILRLSQEISSIRDGKVLVQQIISASNRITGAERGAIFLRDPSTKAGFLKLRASRTLTDQDVNASEFDGPMTLIRRTIKTGKGCVKVFDGDQNGGQTDQKTIHSCICVPMIIRDKAVGVMYHDNSLLTSNFNETDLDILSFFAAQAAIAIDNAQAYGEIKRLNRHLKEEKEYYKEKVLENVHFEEIVGKSQGILEVLSNVQQVADTDATVLILGETGVGKELVARAVHAQSSRNKGPFIRVHCSALPESLISSELFGHEKGAFTGASQKRIGRFELADNGTLFLDEIGELPMEIQVHLLRVLQTGEFERVGGSKTLKSNFRLVLATNRNLEKEVQKKRFRQDLYYRINVFPILVPPLRDRKEDIPLLASYFSHLYGKRLNKPSCKIRQKDVGKLMDYDWPGNVRELENVIERAMILSKGADLIFPALQWLHPISTAENENGLPTLVENERHLIIAALRQTSGRIQGKGGAAELLGINHNTLKSRMRKFGIVRDQVLG